MSAISNSEVKLVRSLFTKKGRRENSLFIVEGEKLVKEALHSSMKVRNIWHASDIGEATMSKISALSSPSPALAVVEIPSTVSSEIPQKGLYLALDGIRDPGNMGTILRIADWFGVDGVFASEDSVDFFNPKVVQSTMGAIFRVKFSYADIPSLCNEVKSRRGKVYGTFLSGSNIYTTPLSCGIETPSVIVIGNEADGISETVAACVTDSLFIPPYPADCQGSESLNAAMATAITVAEFRRRTYPYPSSEGC